MGSIDGGGFQRLPRGHSGFDEPAQLARVFAEHGVHGVRTHGETNAGAEGFAGGFEIALDEGIQLVDRTGGVVELAEVIGVVTVAAPRAAWATGSLMLQVRCV